MPSKIYDLAKVYEAKLLALNDEQADEQAKVLGNIQNQIPEPTDEKIIQTFEEIEENQYVLLNFLPTKNNEFFKSVGKNAIILLCQQFVNEAQTIQKTPWLSQIPDEIFGEILKFLTLAQLKKIAPASRRFNKFAQKTLTEIPIPSRDYDKKPHIVSHQLAAVRGHNSEPITFNAHLFTSQMELIVSFSDVVFIKNIISTETIKSFKKTNHTTRCLAQLSYQLIIAGGEIPHFIKKNTGFINVWNIKTGECVTTLSSDKPIERLAVSSVNKIWSSEANKIKLWVKESDLMWDCSYSFTINPKNPKDKIIGLFDVPTQNQLIIATQHQIFIYDTQKKEIIQQEDLPNITSLQISPDNVLAIGLANGWIYLWRKESVEQSWKNFRKLTVSSSAVTAMVFLKNKIICGSQGDRNGARVRALDWKEGKDKPKILLNCKDAISYLCVVQDLLLSVDENVNVYFFPKLQPTLALTMEKKKAEVADTEQTPPFMP